MSAETPIATAPVAPAAPAVPAVSKAKPLTLKQRVDDIWPMHGKRVLLRVDFNVPIKGGKIRNDYRIREALSTIRKIIDQGGMCIIMSHLGRPKGHPWSEVRYDDERRKLLMKTWTDENGTQKTEYFSRLAPDEKVKILKWSSAGAQLASTLGDGLSTRGHCGRTLLFSKLKEAEKLALLQKFRSETKKESQWTQMRQYENDWDLELSLRPVAERLSQLIDRKVEFAPDCLDAEAYVRLLKPGDVLVLENVRFYANESSSAAGEQLEMARQLASYGDYFVCDAFGTAHRKAATITGIPRVLGHGAAGDLMSREITQFATALNNPVKPFIAIVGGAKVSDKILLLEHLLSQIDVLLIGGAMAYTFLRSMGVDIGKSYSERGQSFSDKYVSAPPRANVAGSPTPRSLSPPSSPRSTSPPPSAAAAAQPVPAKAATKVKRDMVVEAANLLRLAQQHGVRVVLPVDHVCYTMLESPRGGAQPLVTPDATVPANMMALDIGPKTVALFTDAIKTARTCIWNGPVGVFEIPPYQAGSFAVAAAVAARTAQGNLLSIVGGGDTASVVEKAGLSSHMWHVSTGGGAALELMEGKQLPGIQALSDRRVVPTTSKL
jgi:phosphoglycerate kinase